VRNRTPRGLIMLLALTVSFSTASAQDPRLTTRLDAQSTKAFNAMLDSARAQGLPVEPLWDKYYEGIGKGADGPRIIAAVRTLSAELAVMHRALGAVASTDELKAGASAVHVGAPAVELGKMKKQSRLRSLALPFTVVADLISRGVPVGTAVNAVKSLVGAGAKDKDINEFQRNVKEDIQQGAPPAAAAETRAKAKPEKGGKPEGEQQQLDP
jgi:hypothetical protein